MTAIIVTGSRDYADRRFLRARLREELDRSSGPGLLQVLVGDCPTGADAFARSWCHHYAAEADLTVFRADWKRYGRTAGPGRNAEMVASEPKADRCLAFYAPPPALNRGTSGCAGLARAAGIEVLEYDRPRVWADLLAGDWIIGSDGGDWTVEEAPTRDGGMTLSQDGRRVTGHPDPAGMVIVRVRGELGRAVDSLAWAGLGPERIDTGRNAT